jgi:hypothetical protein
VALNRLQEALPDLQKAVQIRPDDFTAQDRLRYVQARLAPAPVAAAATAAPVRAAPTPKPTLLTRTNIFIGLGALLALFIVIVVIAKLAVTRGTDDVRDN